MAAPRATASAHRACYVCGVSVYVSNTKQIPSPHAWTFAGLQVDESGACYAAERNGLRDIKPKGLLVRYPNPFAGGGKPEVIYEAADPFQHMWRAPSGGFHLLGKKHHFSVNGTFKSKEITKGAQKLLRVWGAGERVILALGYPAAYLEIVNGEYVPLAVGLSTACACEDLTGSAADDIYVADEEGITHFDGKEWRAVKGAPKGAQLACVSRDEVFATGIDPEQGRVFAIYRGNARDGFKGLVRAEHLKNDGSFGRIFHALGAVHLIQTHGADRGLYRLSEGEVSKLMGITGFAGRVAGSDVLWVENGIELLCFDGTTWKQVPRVWQEKSKA